MPTETEVQFIREWRKLAGESLYILSEQLTAGLANEWMASNLVETIGVITCITPRGRDLLATAEAIGFDPDAKPQVSKPIKCRTCRDTGRVWIIRGFTNPCPDCTPLAEFYRDPEPAREAAEPSREVTEVPNDVDVTIEQVHARLKSWVGREVQVFDRRPGDDEPWARGFSASELGGKLVEAEIIGDAVQVQLPSSRRWRVTLDDRCWPGIRLADASPQPEKVADGWARTPDEIDALLQRALDAGLLVECEFTCEGWAGSRSIGGRVRSRCSGGHWRFDGGIQASAYWPGRSPLPRLDAVRIVGVEPIVRGADVRAVESEGDGWARTFEAIDALMREADATPTEVEVHAIVGGAVGKFTGLVRGVDRSSQPWFLGGKWYGGPGSDCYSRIVAARLAPSQGQGNG